MNYFMSLKKLCQQMLLFLLIIIGLSSCQEDGLLAPNNNSTFYQKLSEYNIYQGAISDLNPTSSYQLYQLGSELFSDHAKKQRLIYLPPGTQMQKIDDGLPDFPDGTILVKTFYYHKDDRDFTKGSKIVETRLLIKESGQWNVGTYLWNDNQTDAQLVTAGFNKLVNFIDQEGKPQVIAYQLPSNRACASCHNVNEVLSPIGPKMRNLNIHTPEVGGTQGQLVYLQSRGILNQFDVSTVGTLPPYQDVRLPLDVRARAYMDINCAHCHDPKGSSPDLNMFYGYDLSLEDTKIPEHKESIIQNMVEGSMPQIGTSVIDEEGSKLIVDYINSL